MTLHPIGESYSEVKPFPEMLSVVTEPGLEVFQVTTDLEQTGDSRGAFFSPDGSRFVFKRGTTAPHGGLYWCLCDVADGFRLRNVTLPEDNPCAPFVGADGRHLYYFQDFSHLASPRITLRRVSLDTFKTEDLAVYDKPVEGIGRRPRAGGKIRVRGMTQGSSLRADGKKVALGFNFVGDDNEDHFAPVFIDLDTYAIHGFEWEPYSWRVAPHYFRGPDPAHRGHFFMGRVWNSQSWDADGKLHQRWYSDVHRASLHIVDEGGRILGTVPIGGEGEGVDHPCWRGGRYEIAVHSGDFNSAPHWRGVIRVAAPVACGPSDYQKGRFIPGGRSVDLTRRFTRPDVCHQSWHADGIHAAFDTEGWAGRGTPVPQGPTAFLYLGKVIEPAGEDPYLVTKYLLHPRSSWSWAGVENCQELSPDLNHIFFNSDWTCTIGRPQLFAVRGFTWP
jgi:hypothetical protein